LPGNRFLVNMPGGRPAVIDRDGRVERRWASGGVERAERHGDVLLLAGKQRVWAADLGLRELWQFTWPGASGPVLDANRRLGGAKASP
jgi:hypothetical protein